MASATFYSEKAANRRNSVFLVVLVLLLLGVLGGAIGYALTGSQAGMVGAILVAVVAVATLPALAAALNPASAPIGTARVGRLLDAAEQLLVVALVVLTAGVLGLFDWASSVLG